MPGLNGYQLVGKLQFQLRGVDTLGLRDEDAALPQLQLLAQSFVGRAQSVALLLEVCDALRKRSALSL
jgi:hypothetical protein